LNQKTPEPGETETDRCTYMRRVVYLGTPGMHGGGGAEEFIPVPGRRI
jgi:hypothetical protein